MDVNKQTAPTAFQQVPPDARRVVPFCKLNADALAALDRTLGTGLTVNQFRWLQTYYTQTEHRDPTVGELRLFAALDGQTRLAAERVAAGELYTDSAELAEVWADIMARRHALHPEDRSPCTIPDILTLTGQWMERTGERKAPTGSGSFRVLTDSPVRPAGSIVHIGDKLLERMVLSGGDGRPCESRLFTTRSPKKKHQPAQPGDLLVWVKDARAEAIEQLCTPGSGESVVADAVLLTGTPLPLAVLALCGGATVSLERLFPNKVLPSTGGVTPTAPAGQVESAQPTAQTLPEAPEGKPEVSQKDDPEKSPESGLKDSSMYSPKDSAVLSFCRLGTETAQTGNRADYLLRIRYTRAQMLKEVCHTAKLTAVAFGRVMEDGFLTLTQSGQVAVRARTQFVRFAAGSVYLHTFRLPVPKEPALPGVRRLMAAPVPLPRPVGNDLTPTGREAVALMRTDDPLYLPSAGVLSSTAACDLPADGTAYPLARNTVLAALAALCARGVRRQEITLSVTLTCPGRPEETVLSAVCGLYRAAAELCLPIPDAAFVRGDDTRLSVSAWAPIRPTDPRLATRSLSGKPGRRLYLFFSGSDAPDSSPDWADLRSMMAYLVKANPHLAALYPVVSDGTCPLELLQRWVADHPGAGVALDPACRETVSTPRRLAFLAEYEDTNPDTPAGVEIGCFTDTPGVTFTAACYGGVPPVGDTNPVPGAQEGSWVSNGSAPAVDTPHAGAQTDAAVPTANRTAMPGTGHAKVAILPILRPDWEPTLRDVATVLGTQGFRCLMVPVNTVTREQETVFDEHGVVLFPATPVREAIAEDAQRLAEHIKTADLVVLAMGTADAALLMADKTIRQALDNLTDPSAAAPEATGAPTPLCPRLLVIGDACPALSRAGFLADTLAHGLLSAVPTAGLALPVTLHTPVGANSGVGVLLRLCRCDLLAPVMAGSPDACLMTVHYAPNRDVPDGYWGRGGAVLGFVNGLPDLPVLPLS